MSAGGRVGAVFPTAEVDVEPAVAAVDDAEDVAAGGAVVAVDALPLSQGFGGAAMADDRR